MVFEDIVQRIVDAHGSRDRVVGYGASHTAARGFVHFVDSTHVEGRATVGADLLDKIAVAIIDKGGIVECSGRGWRGCAPSLYGHPRIIISSTIYSRFSVTFAHLL